MPKRTDIHKIMIIGSGPIVIGQGCEFDYSGAQACKALHEEGYEIVLVNSNPATITTDTWMSDHTYIEPLTLESLTMIIEKERPDALLATLGGQTGLNMGMLLESEGVLERFGVVMIGATSEIIAKAEDRRLFKETMQSIGIPVPTSGIAGSFNEGIQIIKEIGFPVILRPAYTMAGAGGATAYNMEEYERMLAFSLQTSPVKQVLIEKSVLGWKEIEFEVMRDALDNVIIITSLENVDAMGVHSGDSVIVAPALTLTESEITNLTDMSRKIASAVGMTGGINIQYAVNPVNDDVAIIEINPRATRSSALASKAPGFPIAYVATKLAVGLTFNEIQNGDTGKIYLGYEPAADYVVTKISRFTFDKFPGADETLSTSMKAVGEVMAIGRSFKESLQKCIRSLETGRYGLGSDGKDLQEDKRNDIDIIRRHLIQPNADRLFYIRYAVENGLNNQDISNLTKIDPWFIQQIRELVDFEAELKGRSVVSVSSALLLEAKRNGYSDIQLAYLLETTQEQVRLRRQMLGIESSFCQIDAQKPYFYSTYESSDSTTPSDGKKKVVILGGGPNRIGQGIEFDCCCVQTAYALKEAGYESIIINCNPGALSTDFDTSDKLYFEPLTIENVLDIVEREKPLGVIVQHGGRTALNLRQPLKIAGINILGTTPESIERAENRKLFSELIVKLGLLQTDNDMASSLSEAIEKANKIGYPVLVRSSHDPRGRMRQIAYDDKDISKFILKASPVNYDRPIIIDRFLEDAIGVDVDAVSDGETTLVCGVMEHIEQAGVHSGDSACSLPPYSQPVEIVDQIKRQSYAIAKELEIRGLINIQFAVKDGQVYVLKVNPRAARTTPFVSKATGIPWAKVATKIMLGQSLIEQGITEEIVPKHVSVKEAVFPFFRFPGVDVVLGPEMKSTGVVMGIDESFGNAYIKAQIASGQNLQQSGMVFLSVADIHKADILEIAKGLTDLGFTIVATAGTAGTLSKAGIPAKIVSKIGEGRPDAIDMIKNKEIALIINTPSGKKPRAHEITIRSAIVAGGIPIITTIAGAKATLHGLKVVREQGTTVKSLQEFNKTV